jgi:hypothetical protein
MSALDLYLTVTAASVLLLCAGLLVAKHVDKLDRLIERLERKSKESTGQRWGR